MKTLASFFLFALTAVSVFAAESVWPGWSCNDLARIEAGIAATTNPNRKIDLTILKNIVNSKPESYEALCKEIENVVDAAENLSAEGKAAYKKNLKKQIPLLRGIFQKEAWAFCKANPSGYDIFYYLNSKAAAMLGFSDTDCYTGILNNLLNNNYSAGSVKSAVARLVDLGITAKVTTQKEDLQKLNRRYSKQLLNDKTSWEPVIALIRLAIETY